MNTPNLITLTTDFGLQDAYVGQIKGTILRLNREAAIVDLTHSIKAHDILTAAMIIRSSYHYFPQQSVHMIVVDPTVGSQRKIIAIQADNHLFIAPDNGSLTFLLRDKKIQAAHSVSNRSLFPREISATFHGRDIMAPVAAALAGAMELKEVGPQISTENCVTLDIPKTVLEENSIKGRVIHIDRFGNIQTTITARDLSQYQPSSFAGIKIRSQNIDVITTTYSDSPEGELVGVVDSSGHLEIAVNRGSAAERIQCEIGDPVTVLIERNHDE